MSPSLTNAIGPHSAASGQIYPTLNPPLAPEKRPSVITAVFGILRNMYNQNVA